MFDAIAPRYELVNHLLTLNMDRRWRRRAVEDLQLAPASLVLDVATGTGDFGRELVRHEMCAVGVDLSFGMLTAGDVSFPLVQANAVSLPFLAASFDGVTCGYALRNFTDLEGSLSEMARVLRPGGRMSLLEVAEPTGRFLRWGFRIWFRHIVPCIGSLLSDRSAYRYLPASTAYLPESNDVTAMLSRVGFTDVDHRMILGGLSQQFVATRRP